MGRPILEGTFCWYTPDQIRALLTEYGFDVLTIKGNNLDEDVNETHWGIMMVAKKR